jgi:hypothetical protein
MVLFIIGIYFKIKTLSSLPSILVAFSSFLVAFSNLVGSSEKIAVVQRKIVIGIFGVGGYG